MTVSDRADPSPKTSSDAPSTHQLAGLVYVSDQTPGIRRLRRGKGFVYRQPDGRRLDDARQLERIRKLAIPPAYTAVWICTQPRGHLQATGRDARGRKQYRYHPDWRLAREEDKFERMAAFGVALPRIRNRARRDLGSPGKSPQRESVIAAIVHLLDTTLVRVGNDEYARENGSFGLTTLRKRHADLRGAALRLRFRGKSGVTHDVALHDRRIARIVMRCQALPGQHLFQYVDDEGESRSIGSSDVNDYLREASGGDFTAKDFRTWHASVLALERWRRLVGHEGAAANPALAARLLADVAGRLGNTVAVCRKSYVHPAVLALATGQPPTMPPRDGAPRRKAGLGIDERRLLDFLQASARG